MADSILRLKVESSEYDSKIRRATEGLKRYADGCRQAGGTLEYLDDGVLEFTQALGKMDTVSRDARGKISELTKSFTDLKLQYNQLTQKEKKSPFGQALSSSLDQLKTRIADGKSELAGINQELNGSTNILDALSSKFGVNIQQLAGWGSAIGAAAGAAKVMKDAFFQMESNIDEWGRIVQSSGAAYETFLNTLNGGDWSNFFTNLSTAVRGARDLYDAMDRLSSIKANNQAAIATTQLEIAQLRLQKQQGKNVDAQIKDATARLAALQKEGTDAGKAAGRKMIEETVRNIYNTTPGAKPLSGDSLNKVVDEILKGGQKVFDKYRKIYEDLGRKAESWVTTYGPGGVQNVNRTVDMNKLSEDERRRYILARAVTEGESRIQRGIAQYAQATQESTAATREEFKGNRYALQGVRGGTSGSGKTTTLTEKELTIQQQISKLEAEAYTATEERRKEIAKQVQELDKELAKQKEIRDQLHGIKKEQEAILPQSVRGTNIQTQEGLNAYLSMLTQQRGGTVYGSAAYNNLTGQIVDMTTLKNLLNESMKAGLGTALFDIADETGRDFWTRAMEGGVENIDWQSIVDKINEQRKAAGLDAIKLDFVTGGINGEKSPATSTGTSNGKGDFNKLVGNVSTITGALNQLGVEIPEGFSKTLGVLQVISTITMAIQSLVGLTASTSILNSIPIIGWFLHNGGVVHAANGFSGEVPGNMFSGDNIPAMLNSGETVLTRSQVGILSSALNAQTYSGTGRSEAVIESDQIRLVLQNGAQAQGKTLGEYLNI